MPVDSAKIIGEILGQPADKADHPAKANYQCPFVNSPCTKRSQKVKGPYPICSVWHSTRSPRLISTCPKRFFQVNFLNDVIKHCWNGEKPENPQIAHEVMMRGFGKVDFVIADLATDGDRIRDFISVELQAVDNTGSVEQAYQGVINNRKLSQRPSYGFNWSNVRKRCISQLISKGIYHHHWGTRMVAVLQTPLYEQFRKYVEWDELEPSAGNIVFMLYDYAENPDENGNFSLQLDRVVSTSHNSLMMGSLYREPLPKDDFCRHILDHL